MSEQLALLPDRLTAHLQLTLLALLVGTAVSLPLGVLVTRVRWLEQPALAIAGVIQTVPSLALLAMMVPVLAALELQSIGFLPAIIGLTLYGRPTGSAQYRYRHCGRGPPRSRRRHAASA